MSAGRLLVVLLIATGLIGSLVSGTPFYTHLLVAGIILIAGAWIWVNVLARAMRLTRNPDSTRGSVGDILKEQYEVTNTSRLPGLWVEVYNEMQIPMASGSRFLSHLRPNQKQSYVARTWLTRRGGYPVGPTVVKVSDPLGLFRRERVFPAERSLVILPMIFPIDSFVTPPGLMRGGAVVQSKTTDITPHAAGVRDYVAGDPMRKIHWPTSARRGVLMVKEFEQDPQAEVWLFLDAQRKAQFQKAYETPAMPLESLLFSRRPKLSLAPSTLEYEISIAASLAHHFIQERRAVGLVTEDRGYTVLAAERSERQDNKIRETLAFVEGMGDLPISALAAAQARQLSQGSNVVLITASTSLDLTVVADDLQRRKLKPVVILLAAESFGGPRGSQEIAMQLMEQQIPVCLVYCDADLAQTLSSFSAHTERRDMTSWQRPVLSHLT